MTPPNEFSAQAVKDNCGNERGECDLGKTLFDNLAAPDGSRFTFETADVFPGSQSGGLPRAPQPHGWSSEQLPQNYYARGVHVSERDEPRKGSSQPQAAGSAAWNQNWSAAFDPDRQRLRDNTTGSYQLSVTPWSPLSRCGTPS